MLLFESVAFGKSLLVTNHSTLNLFHLANQKNGNKETELVVYSHSCEIIVSTYLPNKAYLVLIDATKTFIMLDTRNNNAVVTSKATNKRAMKIIASRDENSIVIGDKTGDVYLLDLSSTDLAKQEFKLIMGHLSMLTDLSLSLDQKSVITSDRDEKIRISGFPNAYNVENYLLGHKEFVIQIEQIDSNRLISSSGDSRLILWDLSDSSVIQDVNLLDLVDDESAKSELKGVDRFDYDSERNRLLLHLFGSKFLMHFVFEEGKFRFVNNIDLNEEISGFVRVAADFYLFLSLVSNEAKSVWSIKQVKGGKLIESLKDDENDLESCQKLLVDRVKVENVEKLRNEYINNYLGYFKMVVNNTDEYYAKKRERIECTTGSSSKRKLNEIQSDSNTSLNK